MQWNGIKIPIVVLAMLAGLVFFWGVQQVYSSYNYERPLNRLLEEDKDVAAYQIDDDGQVLEVQVKLNKVDNLQETYSRLNRSLQEIAGRRNFTIILQDQRDETLNRIYYRARLAACEALDRGNYLEMEDYVSQLAAGEGSRARIWLDQDRLYLQIDHGDNYLYEIVPRTKASGAVYSGGSERRSPS